MKKCEICGKRMWFWQELIMTTDGLGNVVVPFAHDKCSRKLNGKPYRSKIENDGFK